MNWTEEQVNGIAPDAASLKAGRGLAIPGKWNNIGLSEIALWGECQGSGSKPYKTQVDFRDTAFKCSCPSRKFPCKHSIGILFLLVEKKELFTNDNPPDWVSEWLDSRQEKKQKQVERKEAKKEVDPEKKAKTESKRLETVEAGINELDLWLKDLFRKGINNIHEQPYTFFKNISSRMIDAKAPGLAKKIDDLSSIRGYSKDWSENFLEKSAELFILIQSFKNLNNLAEENQQDIKTQIGWNYSQDELLQTEGLKDNWLIISQSFEEENNLKLRKTYLLGFENNKYALLLDYSYGNKAFDNLDLLIGKSIDAEIVYYPSAYPVRALIKNKQLNDKFIFSKQNGFENIDQLFEHYSYSLSLNPFNSVIPVLLKNVIPVFHDDKFLILDEAKDSVPISINFANSWLLLALSGGHSVEIFGEWNGNYFCPLSVFVKDKLYSLAGHTL